MKMHLYCDALSELFIYRIREENNTPIFDALIKFEENTLKISDLPEIFYLYFKKYYDVFNIVEITFSPVTPKISKEFVITDMRTILDRLTEPLIIALDYNLSDKDDVLEFLEENQINLEDYNNFEEFQKKIKEFEIDREILEKIEDTYKFAKSIEKWLKFLEYRYENCKNVCLQKINKLYDSLVMRY